MPVSEELARQLHREYCEAARPREYITAACKKYGLAREEVRWAIGLRTRDPTVAESAPTVTVSGQMVQGKERAEQSPAPTQRQEGERAAAGGASGTQPPTKKRKRGGGRPKMLDAQAEQQILDDLKQGMTLRAAAAKHGCCTDTIYRIRRRHLQELYPDGDAPRGGRPALSREKTQAMLEDMRQGMTIAKAAVVYGCSEATVVRIRHRHGMTKNIQH